MGHGRTLLGSFVWRRRGSYSACCLDESRAYIWALVASVQAAAGQGEIKPGRWLERDSPEPVGKQKTVYDDVANKKMLTERNHALLCHLGSAQAAL